MRHVFLGLCASVLIFVIGSWGEKRLPSRSRLVNANVAEPTQVKIEESKSFALEFQGKHYTLYPRATYDLKGLIVSQHRADSLMDQMHLVTGDFLNSRDFCIVWGKILSSGLYEKTEFSSGDWTCYWRAPYGVYEHIDFREIANNHVLAKDEHIRRQLEAIETGDEVHIKGMLVDYDLDGRPARKTSLVRDDTENGACETLYVESVDVLASHNSMWKHLRQLGFFGVLACLVGIFALMAKAILGK